MKIKKIEENIFKVIMVLCTAIISSFLFLILYTIISKGLPYMSVDMVTKSPEGGFYFGKSGGILNAIVGSMLIAGGATVLSLFISIPVVLYINFYNRKDSALVFITRTSMDVLFGVPSIVYGAFAFAIMIALGIKASVLAGIIAVTILVMPIMIRTMDEVAALVPRELNDTVLSLGATRWEVCKVVLRQIAPGVLTAILLAFGRGMGDAATVLFTAGYTDNIPTSLSQPAATLPLAIFFQLSSPMPEVQGRAYAAALILTVIVLCISLASRYVNRRLSRHKIY